MSDEPYRYPLCALCQRPAIEHVAYHEALDAAEASSWPLQEAKLIGWHGLYCPVPEWARKHEKGDP